MWNLEKWSWWTSLQGRSRGPNAENGLVDIERRRRLRDELRDWRWRIHYQCIQTYTLPGVKQTARGKLLYSTGSSARCSVMTWRGGMEEDEGRLKREGLYGYIWLINAVLQQKQHSIIKQYIPKHAVCSVTESCPTLCDPVDCSRPGSFAHGISQARILLEWVAISFSRRSSQPGIKLVFTALAGGFVTAEPPGKPCIPIKNL